ncbi:FKBP-type peptidyl-prolyl cis-trans isomerase [Nocardioides sp. Y6]|uniref:peptidylprolyl isomerase n=1 Tax=Nocardioides malaquae TaxID=2773426 RepID=A0ABR9RSU8_9ACTN|nr:FKBP-type peptidyl-prolyl cis-trans isomerase [Nocardioides malaquae]MBE7324455.1 FKBP-type peptidyl-prolyl cis-trans isomerase [Nocardioides malaquae]
MSLRRTLTAAAVSLGMLTLAACGDKAAEGGPGLDAVTIEAEPGTAPTVEFGDEKLDPAETETKVLVEGDGEETAIGDMVTTYIWVGNGFDRKEVLNTYEAGEPERIELVDGLFPGLKEGLVGHKVGSIVAVASTAEDAFGEGGNPALGIGDGDSVLFVTEIVSKLSDDEVKKFKADEKKATEQQEKQAKKVERATKNAPDAASGTPVDPAGWAPEVTYPKGKGKVPTFDFSGAPKPNGKLQVTQLIEGEGKKVKAGQTLVVHYVGQVFGAEQPFDSSYSRNEPASFPIGVGQVVQGWDQALVGQKVGSRVIVQIPPELGYGEAGNEGAGIKGTDTIVFAVDILAAV